jgi:GGDEF domain-containing protein
LFGRKPCLLFANTTPLALDKHAGLEVLTDVLRSLDPRYLTEGFVVTEGGRYLDLGTGEQLVRVVPEVRIEAARHANPLTFLPGNIPISEHITQLLNSAAPIVACYCDLNDFKPFNEPCGYWRGDDFVILFQSDDWPARCEKIVTTFNQTALSLFDSVALQQGGSTLRTAKM